jgi:drug/metabolite transporter (DMT)-like permease
MSSTAVILILISAILHVAWNLMMKRRRPTLAFYLLASIFGGLCLLPFYISLLPKLPQVPLPVWWALLASGFFQLIYTAGLAGAYRAGDISVAYPILRSLPPVLVAVAAIPLARADRISPLCWLGIAGILAGGAMLPMRSIRDFDIRNYVNPCCALAIFSAIGTAGYSLVDDFALRVLREHQQTSLGAVQAGLLYVPLQICSLSIFTGAYVLLRADERKQFVQILKTEKRASAGAGLCMYLCYGLVLIAFAFAADPSYVVGFRQVSIPLSVVGGVFLLGEQGSAPRFFGVILILSGVVLVAVG